MSVSRVLISSGGAGGPVYVPSSAKVDEQSLFDLQEVKKLLFTVNSSSIFETFKTSDLPSRNWLVWLIGKNNLINSTSFYN